ncbi:MAG: NYN domain-containing protein [Pseudomonadota bacterium]
MSDEALIAVFIDFENLALGAKDAPGGEFKIDLILKRLLQKGRLVYKRAYCDWSGYQPYVRQFHEQGIELIDIPRTKMSGKNSADIRMVVDALDLCYAKQHIDAFALISGDSDFSPLASKLKENDKRVLGCGIRSSTSDLLINNCDEFIFYDDLAASSNRRSRGKSRKKGASKRDKRQEAIDLTVDIVRSLEQDYDPLWGSLVKQSLRRVHPGFNENAYDFTSFSELLKEAESRQCLRVQYDDQRGNFIVSSELE